VAHGSQPFVDWENDKPTVVALREIADGYVTSDILNVEAEAAEALGALDAAAEAAAGEAVEDAEAEQAGSGAAAPGVTPDEEKPAD